MTTQPMTPKRWRPRFSVRTLVVLVTLACCYAACWRATKTRGVADVTQHVSTNPFLIDPHSVAWLPLMVKTDVSTPFGGDDRVELYYFWFFGYVAELPYKRWYVP